ncbi:GDYXXLXY domain-containing protein [Microbulbifer guangxiensis]|uniref:GDYXXLXY domain-containing protein n=1 Tax=Microbulbifer guangxiensis TaxID=2904249 RepID=UPI001F234C61|nr:GDYXXLXY domain-containing protein [Microbulbifer guangxiensis]
MSERTARQLLALAAAIVFQALVLFGMVVLAQIPLWTGQEIQMETTPVDPRSLFRGNYARLQYAISELGADQFDTDRPLRNGEEVYVRLVPGKNGLYRYAGVSLDKPDEGVFLRGRVSGQWWRSEGNVYRIRYGIEAFFAPKERALALEAELRDGGVAVLRVSGSGRARLAEVLPERN